MKLIPLSLLVGTLSFLGTQAAQCAPQFLATATLTAPAAGDHTANMQNGPYWGINLTATSTNHSVSITGEPANALVNVQYDLYIVGANGNSPDDFYSNPIQCDVAGTFKHLANNTGNLSNTGPYYAYMHTTNFTDHAVSDIYNVGNTAQKNHADSAISFTVSH